MGADGPRRSSAGSRKATSSTPMCRAMEATTERRNQTPYVLDARIGRPVCYEPDYLARITASPPFIDTYTDRGITVASTTTLRAPDTLGHATS